MSTIELMTSQKARVTLISNEFIDNFMPQANGSYVKVYLYLLRCLSESESNISICAIADHLEDSEKDILRALSYWEKTGLIGLKKTSDGIITSITINDITQVEHIKTGSLHIQEQETAAVTKEPMPEIDKPVYSPAQIQELTSSDEVKWLLKIIEIYLERYLKPADIQLILYLYENVGFSVELILYLYEYCISKNKKNPTYIEAVAMSWAKEGIDTVEKAEQSSAAYNTNYNAVTKAFGLDRSPGTIERQFINKWYSEYHFSTELIAEACNRTLLATSKPNFKYADNILKSWKKQNVHHLSDIAKLDKEHAAAKKNVQKEENNVQKNRFNSFPQRTYTKEEYLSMEERLLGKLK